MEKMVPFATLVEVRHGMASSGQLGRPCAVHAVAMLAWSEEPNGRIL